MLKLTARYADIWNTGYMGKPETMSEAIDKIHAACQEVGRDPATLAITALVGLWFPDLQEKKPTFFDNPISGTPEEIVNVMLGYEQLGVQHIMFQIEPYGSEGRRRLSEALKLYHDIQMHKIAEVLT